MELRKLDVNKVEDFVTKSLVVIEDINRLQVEKDSVLESYNRVRQEFARGAISFDVYKATVDRFNSELDLLDSTIERQIKLSEFSADSIMKYLKLQMPVRIRLLAGKS